MPPQTHPEIMIYQLPGHLLAQSTHKIDHQVPTLTFMTVLKDRWSWDLHSRESAMTSTVLPSEKGPCRNSRLPAPSGKSSNFPPLVIRVISEETKGESTSLLFPHRHKATSQGSSGQRKNMPFPLNISKALVLSPCHSVSEKTI